MNDSDSRSAKLQSDLLESNGLLRRQVEQLKTQLMNSTLINELTRVLHSCGELDGIMKIVLLAIKEIAGFDRAIMFEVDKQNFCLKPRLWVGITGSTPDDMIIPLGFEGGEITDALFLNRHIVVERPDAKSDHFSSRLHSETYVVIPLVNRVTKRCWDTRDCNLATCPAHGSHNPYCWSVVGACQLSHTESENDKRRACVGCGCFKGSGVFWIDRASQIKAVSSDDITSLTAIINLAAIIIENFRILKDLDVANNSLQKANTQLNALNHELQIAHGRIKADLDHAQIIQRGLLPQDIEKTSAFSVCARYLSADAVGGDYYDLFETSPGIHHLVVADVSGHGIASALVMSMVKMLLKTFAPSEPSPQKTLERINKSFLSEVKTDNFVTIFYAIVDTNTKTFRYTSAGHCPVLLLDRRDASCTQIKADGLFLGVFPDMMLRESSMQYQPGSHRLVLYTDGLIEARSPSEQLYGADRLTKIAMKTISLDVKETLENILVDQKNFCGTATAVEDDITVLILDL
jgi:serine phosphatase RsbU (regulator of sigma subunit)